MQNEQTPAAGPLTAESVKLLQPGDRLKWLAERDHYGTFLHRMDDVSAGICWHSDTYDRKHYSPGFMMEFVKRPAPPKEDLGDGVSRDVEPDEAYRPHVASPVSSSSVVQGDASGVERRYDSIREAEDRELFSLALRPQPSGETRDCPHGLHSVGSCSDCSVNRSMDDQPHAPVSRPAGEGEREAVARLEAMLPAIERIFPVRVTETPDYAELAFNECGAQAMTIEPDTWTALNSLGSDLRTVLSLLSPAAPDAGGGSLGPLGEEPDSALKIATDLHAAYEQLIYGLPKYLDAENLTDEENMIREAYITLDVTAHRLAALQPGGER